MECAGTCINVLTDKNNCGACGATCATGGCYAGNCGGSNLMVNGDFSNGGTYWNVTQASTGVTYGTAGTSYCVSLPTYGLATLGWPDPLSTSLAVPIVASSGYTLSYSVSSSSTLYSFAAKVGHVVTPYTAVYSIATDHPDVLPTQFEHSFTPTYSDTGAGVAFTLQAYDATTVCFANVSLVRH
jgi:hypothetical protein